MSQKDREELYAKIAEKFGIKYYINFRLIAVPDFDSPTNEYMNSFLTVADVYEHGSWRTIVITGRMYKYLSGRNIAECILYDAQKTQELFMKLLQSDKGGYLRERLTNPIDHFPPRYK